MGNGVTIHGEVFLSDAKGDVTRQPTACHLVAVYHHDVGTAAVVEQEAARRAVKALMKL